MPNTRFPGSPIPHIQKLLPIINRIITFARALDLFRDPLPDGVNRLRSENGALSVRLATRQLKLCWFLKILKWVIGIR